MVDYSVPIAASFNKLGVGFAVEPPPLKALTKVLEDLASLPGCLEYKVVSTCDPILQWVFLGSWVSNEEKAQHYASNELQALIRCVLFHNASRLLFSEPG